MKPFNLEKALAGEPVVLRNGNKAYVKYQLKEEYPECPEHQEVHGYFLQNNNPHPVVCSWNLEGSYYHNPCDKDIVGMWEEPKPTVTFTLPCPLKEPQEEMWFISDEFNVYKSSYSERCIDNLSNDWFSQGRYFASEADAQAWVNAFKNNRR